MSSNVSEKNMDAGLQELKGFKAGLPDYSAQPHVMLCFLLQCEHRSQPHNTTDAPGVEQDHFYKPDG